MTIEYKDSKRIVATSITTSIQGNNGGTGRHVAGAIAGAGGGGGNSSAGSNGGVNTSGGNGGNGTANSITGSSVTYSTGGGGGSAHSAGVGGSSNANNNTGSGSGGATGTVTANTGSGAGGGNNGNIGSAGSAGIVVIRFSTSGNTYSQSGGTVTTSGSDTIISYTTTSGTKTFSPTSSFNVQYLVVGGGGSAGCGNEPNGAGGAGGYLAGSSYAVTPNTYTITVGAGGAQPTSSANELGNNGSNSRFDEFIAIGGGAGGSRGNTASANVGKDGASGGGGGTKDDGSTSTTISGGSATTQTITERPTDVQDNSILVEKNTARRYWFNGTTWTRELYFTDDFSYTSQSSANLAWVPASNVAGRRVNISDQDLDLLNDSGTTNYAVAYDLGSDISDTKWTLRFSADVTLSSGSNNWCFIGLFGSDESVGGDTNQNGIALTFQNDGVNTKFWLVAGVDHTPNSGGWDYFNATDNGTLTSTKYYIQLSRLTATSIEVKIYSDSTYKTLHASMTASGSSLSLGDLRYIKFVNNTTSGSGSIAIVMDDVKFRNGDTSI